MEIKGKQGFPHVNISTKECKLEIIGDSYNGRVSEVYDEIHKWLDEKLLNLNCKFNLIFHFEILNSISRHNVFFILFKLNKFYKKGGKVKVTWICENDDPEIYELANDMFSENEFAIDVILNK